MWWYKPIHLQQCSNAATVCQEPLIRHRLRVQEMHHAVKKRLASNPILVTYTRIYVHTGFITVAICALLYFEAIFDVQRVFGRHAFI